MTTRRARRTPGNRAPGTTVGTIGSPWRATATPWGALDPWAPAASERVDWWIGADDRWHTPEHEPSTRQRRIDGAPVVETSVRVPSGDAIQRIYAVADHGGLTVIEVENRSPAPFAVAVSRADLLASRPPSRVEASVPGVPDGAVVYPVAHRTTLRLALAHDAPHPGPLPGELASAEQVARGWLALAERGARFVVPDVDVAAAVVAARTALVLEGPPPDGNDDVAHLLALSDLARAGEDIEVDQHDPAPALAAAIERILRRHRPRRFGRSGPPPALAWDEAAALEGGREVLARLGEERAATDLAAVLASFPPPGPPPDEATAPDAARFLALVARRLVAPAPGGADVMAGVPSAWIGSSIEAHGLTVPAGAVSVAVRWHGERPALLWECSAPMRLTATRLDPSWSSEATTRGEALLAPTSR